MVLAMFTAGPFLKRENDKNDHSRKKRKITKCSVAHSGKKQLKNQNAVISSGAGLFGKVLKTHFGSQTTI
jgi:hypothetical protein